MCVRNADSRLNLTVRLQYVADLHAKLLNVRCSAYSGYPSELLRYLPLKGRNAPVTHRSLAASEGRECRISGHTDIAYYLQSTKVRDRVICATAVLVARSCSPPKQIVTKGLQKLRDTLVQLKMSKEGPR